MTFQRQRDATTAARAPQAMRGGALWIFLKALFTPSSLFGSEAESGQSVFGRAPYHLVRLGVACLRAQASVMQALSAAVRRRAAESQQELATQYGRTADERRVIPARDISLGSGTGDDGVEELAATVAPVTDSPPPVSPASASAVHFISSAGSSSWA